MSVASHPNLKELRRYAMLEGRCSVPEEIVQLVGSEYRADIEAFFNSLWFNYLKNKGTTSLVYWYDRFNNETAFNKLLMHLSRSGWIISTVAPARNWAEVGLNEDKLLQYCSAQELQQIRLHKKFVHYILEDKATTVQSKTRLGRSIQDTGIRRPGFMKASNTRFSYDTEMLEENYDIVLLNLVKSMDKIRETLRLQGKEMAFDLADYDSVSRQILDYHIDCASQEFTTGDNTNDSRGRAIKDALRKVFNPISNKDARSCLVIPEESRQEFKVMHLPAVYLAIAELLGTKTTSKMKKVQAGKSAYDNRTKLELDPDSEEDRKEWHQNMWLTRLYRELDKYHIAKDANIRFYWSVPVECDATASMIMLTGALLGDENYLTLTNAYGDELHDFWSVPNISRQVMKKVGTPKGYGSSKTPKQLLDNSKTAYTAEELQLVTEETTVGRLALMNIFKDFIINNVQPKEIMTVQIKDESFTIQCNRYKNVGDRHVDYILYDTAEEALRLITHTKTHSEADLVAFKRYFVTLLIHNLDSQIADKLCGKLSWVIDIHDAFIISPCEVAMCKQEFGVQLKEIYDRRNEILANYFTSINIEPAVIAHEWHKVCAKVKPIKEWNYNDMALK